LREELVLNVIVIIIVIVVILLAFVFCPEVLVVDEVSGCLIRIIPLARLPLLSQFLTLDFKFSYVCIE
jgi:hypothetical protein